MKTSPHSKRLDFFWLWVLRQFVKDQCLIRSSGLTFASLLALVPLLVVIFSVIRVLPVFDQLSGQIQAFIFNNFVPHSGAVIQKYVLGFETQAGRLPIMGFAFLIVTALLMMVNIEKNLNDILSIRYQRHFTGSLLLYWAMLTLGPLLIGVSIAISSYLASFQWLHGFTLAGAHQLLWVFPVLAEFFAMSFLYLVVPHGVIRLRYALLGALVATVLFECAKRLFTLYITFFPTYALLYGALATIPIFLLWLYLCWIMFLFGAEVVNGLRHQHALSSQHDVPLFLVAYQILGHLYTAQRQGNPLNLSQLLDRVPDCSVSSMRAVLALLAQRKWVKEMREVYLLAADVHQKTLGDLIKALRYYVPCDKADYTDSAWDKSLLQPLSAVWQAQQSSLTQPLAELFDPVVRSQ